ncbi:MAG: 2-oxoacid:acceptor oxidoreductase family protein [Candidatus Peregrinibacteria bacterium]
MYEIRWHSRAGQGAITVANALCEIIAHEKLEIFSQSFPDFGAEKKGAAVVVFNRFSEEPIEENYHIEHPNVVVFLDTSLINEAELSYEDILKGLEENGNILLNTSQEKTQFSEKFSGTVFHVPGTVIATQEIGRNIPNVPLLGALLKITNLLSIEKFLPALEKYLLESLPPKVVAGNLRAFQRGYDEVRKV